MESQPPQSSQDELQFDYAESTEPNAAVVMCANCKQAVTECYYQVQGYTFCVSCHDIFAAAVAGGSPFWRFIKAGLFGLIAAVAGACLYYNVGRMTGAEWGIIAIVLGLMVGIAIRFGAGHRGGWPYQLLAVTLTYLAIAGSDFPSVYSAVADAVTESKAATATAPAVGAEPKVAAASAQLTAKEKYVIARIAIKFCLTSPFYTNIMGYIIRAIALYEAWKINNKRKIIISGPFALRPQAAMTPAGEAVTS